MDNEKDEQDRFMGIKRCRTEYQPKPYTRKRKHGEYIHFDKISKESAKHLHNEQWKRK